MPPTPDDPSYGRLVLLDRPLSAAVAWTIMLAPVVAGCAALLLVNLSAWPLSLGLLVGLGLTSVLLLGDRLLVEQRVHERAILCRVRLPLRPSWLIPLALVPPEEVRVERRVDWERPDERVLPASAVLRSLPWGRVVRLPGPEVYAARLRGGESLAPVPRGPGVEALNPSDRAPRWALSFCDPDSAARTIADLARAERESLRRGR